MAASGPPAVRTRSASAASRPGGTGSGRGSDPSSLASTSRTASRSGSAWGADSRGAILSSTTPASTRASGQNRTKGVATRGWMTCASRSTAITPNTMMEVPASSESVSSRRTTASAISATPPMSANAGQSDAIRVQSTRPSVKSRKKSPSSSPVTPANTVHGARRVRLTRSIWVPTSSGNTGHTSPQPSST